MKRGKGGDDEKVGPMFPRLHVNDTTEKGGPRAPPRNKMALYEQFSVPFQRFNPSSNSTSSNSIPLTSSSTMGNDLERSNVFPVRLPSQAGTHRAKSYISHESNGANLDTLSTQLEQRKKVDGDDSRAYDHSRIGQSNDKMTNGFNGEKITLVIPSRQKTVISVKSALTGEIIDGPARQAKKIVNEEDQECSVSNINRFPQGDSCTRQESNDIEHSDGLLDTTMDMDNRNSFHSTVDRTMVLEAASDTEYHDTNIDSPIEKGNSEGSGDLSNISTLENLSSLKLSPDGVVQILGQQLFWKARRKITNQQRAFAVQVFELHRLIKVQHLIAGSSNLMLDVAAILEKFPLQESIPKSLSLEVVVEPQTQNHKQQDHSESLNHRLDCSAEKGVEKTSFSYQKYGSHLSNYTRFSGISDQANVGSQCFNQSPGHQWLIPVMSPSEGLVYKPYPGPGYTGAVYGGYRPFGQGPPDVTFMNPTYGVPDFHQAIAVPPFIPPGGYPYFPPHGVPAVYQSASVSAVEQVNQFAAHGSRNQNGNSSLEEANFNTRNQSSCNLTNQKNGATLHVRKPQPSRERELESSPGEKAQEIIKEKSAEGRDTLSSSFTVPIVSEEALKSLETTQKPQVIRVVPHNPRSATVSAARIFQSIQEERKRYDLV